MAKVSGGVTVTHYLYDIQYRVLEERDGSGQLLALYTYGAGIDEPLTMERGGQTYYYHRDALGSVTELSDASGAIVERYEYDVYGAVTIYDADWITRTALALSGANVSSAGNPYLFTGRRLDPESGNYYYRARVYSPALGRFLSMDSLGFEAGDYNLYCYVFGNPTTMVDPTGLQVPLLPTPVLETWLVLHYYSPGEVLIRSEQYPNASFESPRLLAGVSVEVGFRHVQIHKFQLFPPGFRFVEEYDEVCAEGDLGVGPSDLGAAVGIELSWIGESLVPTDTSLGLRVCENIMT